MFSRIAASKSSNQTEGIVCPGLITLQHRSSNLYTGRHCGRFTSLLGASA
jgi:hypothetical protein